MLKTITAVSAFALLSLTMPVQAQSQMQQPSAQPQTSGSAQFCLKPKGAGAMNCTYQTMAACEQAAGKGSAGDCVRNPKATTGSGTKN